MFTGCYVALVTPFKKDGVLDESGLRKNIKFLLRNKVDGLVPCATTGEAPSLNEDEYERIISITVEEAKGKVKIVPGAGTNSTHKTIALMERAKELGADGCLVVTPYYNKPGQEGLYAHFRAITEAVDIPVIIYNVPGRTGVNILPKTIRRLATDCEKIVGVKEASGSLDQASEIRRSCGPDFDLLSGDDSLTLPMMAIGAQGVISVIANIAPREITQMVNYYLKGNEDKARAIHLRLFSLMKLLFIETNPVPIKKAMEFMKMPAGKPRLPLVEMSKDNAELLKKELTRLGWIE
ncbi:MAG: 4-hydroxy-tetrahydrodipicolinate synthase [candidate division WOR-3 bacterium]